MLSMPLTRNTTDQLYATTSKIDWIRVESRKHRHVIGIKIARL